MSILPQLCLPMRQTHFDWAAYYHARKAQGSIDSSPTGGSAEAPCLQNANPQMREQLLILRRRGIPSGQSQTATTESNHCWESL